MRRLFTFVMLALVLAASSLEAQARLDRPAGWRPARVAKWALLAASVGFGAYALSHSRQAERAYGDLRNLCYDEPARCTLVGNRYPDAGTEALFDRSVSEDRRAQVGIVGGQIALLGGVALFIYDLRNGRGPANIPFPVDSSRNALRGRSFVHSR